MRMRRKKNLDEKLSAAIKKAENSDVNILFETVGALANTENVIDIINRSKVAVRVVDTKKYKLKPEYKATTSCMECDEYDNEKGKDIAKRKMLYHYNSDKVRAINEALADLEVIEERLKRQRKIATERMKRDEKFLRRNCR